MIANAALQEDVDVVGLSILSGAHMTLLPAIMEALRAVGRDDALDLGVEHRVRRLVVAAVGYFLLAKTEAPPVAAAPELTAPVVDGPSSVAVTAGGSTNRFTPSAS